MTSWPPTLPFRWAQVKKRSTSNSIFCHSFGVLFPKRLIFKSSGWIFLRKFNFSVFQWAYFHPPVHFQEVFGRYLWNGPSTLKIEESKMHFFSILSLDGSSPNSNSSSEEELKSEFNGPRIKLIYWGEWHSLWKKHYQQIKTLPRFGWPQEKTWGKDD